MIDQNIEVILITGFATEKTKILGHRLGAYAYLEKPLDLVKIRKCIDEVLVKNRG